jgi:hypothetical protein
MAFIRIGAGTTGIEHRMIAATDVTLEKTAVTSAMTEVTFIAISAC